MSATDTQTPAPDKKAWKTDQEVRWCPGCGDYAILNAVQQTFAEIGLDQDNTVIVSGIGCSSRFPYYMNSYGFHSIHGRAPAIATGLKIANPDLDVWVVTGDGDALSIGGNHLAHVLRRNVGVKVLMFNNRIYGLTKGQYSPTSPFHKVTKSTPLGSLDRPFHPLSFALGSAATFVARGIDVIGPHLRDVLKAAHEHRGTAFVEIWQNCNIFNDGAFETMVERKVRDDRLIEFEHGKPLVYGKEHDKGLILDRAKLRSVSLEEPDANGKQWTKDDLLVWDRHDADAGLAFIASQMNEADLPVPIGVLRSIETEPPYERLVHEQIEDAAKKTPARSLEKLLQSGECWDVV
ncbi:MAG: 2-oxoacid:ferredoxin oxidoreductase subunit beta [Planctomycetes bacterium]|nr:2-oxoacid:ferredoxin oxidoreductase subunit beta [Planctomycetota bacterium]